MHVPLDVTVDFDQALGRNAPGNLQAFCNDGSSTSEKHEIPLLRDTKNPFHAGGSRVLLPCSRGTQP